MFKKELFVIGEAIMIVIAVVMFFPVTGTAYDDDNVLNEILKKLDNIPPAWSQKLPAAKRFVLVLGGAAVLDKETGLVWEKSPSPQATDWNAANDSCHQLELGGRKGWHLPTIEQLASLVDTSSSNPALPEGHPFIGVMQNSWPLYWSATTITWNSDLVWFIVFDSGYIGTGYGKGSNNFYRWCVRGGQSYDGNY